MQLAHLRNRIAINIRDSQQTALSKQPHGKVVMALRQVRAGRNGFRRFEYPRRAFLWRQALKDRFQPVSDALLDAKESLGGLVRTIVDVRDAPQVATAAILEVDFLRDGVESSMLAQSVHHSGLQRRFAVEGKNHGLAPVLVVVSVHS
jgi:hypothetical protein